jgi:hypothetical protein
MTGISVSEESVVDGTEQAGIQFDAAAHAASMVGHHYRVEDFYEVGREKVREYARAVLDNNPAHHDEEAAKGLGYDGLVAPLTFVSIVGMIAQRKLFDEVVTGYDLSQIMQTDQSGRRQRHHHHQEHHHGSARQRRDDHVDHPGGPHRWRGGREHRPRSQGCDDACRSVGSRTSRSGRSCPRGWSRSPAATS